MKKVLFGFNHPALIKAITKFVRTNSVEDLEFQTAATRSAVLREIEIGDYDTVILMEETGKESWSMDEIVQIKDSYNITLIPIISEIYKGKKELVTFCNYGITTAVFISKKNIYNVEEVSRMIYQPRTLKDARIYYGISTMSDIRGGGDILDEVTFESVRNAIVDDDSDEPIGARYISAIGELTPAQVGDLLKRLDDETLDELKKTVEFYDVLEALKKAKVIRSYHIPGNIKKLRKNKALTADEAAFADREKMIEYEPEIIEADTDTVRILDEEKGKASGFAQEALEEDSDLKEDPEGDDDFSITFDEESFPTEDDDFSFSEQLEIKKDQQSEGGTQQKDAPAGEKQSQDAKKKKSGRSGKNPSNQTEEDEENNEKNKKTTRLIIAGIEIGLVVFFLTLLVLFINISIKRKEAAQQTTPSGYNSLYNTEDVATYGLSDSGAVILKDEDGNVLYEGSSSGLDRMPQQEEEIELAVISELQEENSNTVNQTTNDPSGFDEGKEYKGLELVNLLNGNSGADCTLQMKNGATVYIKRGNASIEEFKPSGIYKCSIDGSDLYFTEK